MKKKKTRTLEQFIKDQGSCYAAHKALGLNYWTLWRWHNKKNKISMAMKHVLAENGILD